MLSFESVPRSMWNRQRSSAPAPIITRIGARTSNRMEVITGGKNKDEGGRMKDEGEDKIRSASSFILPPSSLSHLSDVSVFRFGLAFFLGILVRSARRRRLYVSW